MSNFTTYLSFLLLGKSVLRINLTANYIGFSLKSTSVKYYRNSELIVDKKLQYSLGNM
jgi:hypothetical protein